ncbi:ribonuclease H-like domain-containing protein [Tanacetum coccineum]
MSVCNSVYKSKHGDDYIEDPDPVTLISKLDISDPLHLHPNDSTALTVISIKLKGTKNYQVWSCAMLLALEGINITVFIDGSCKRSYTDEVLGRQAKYVWEELKETYDKVDGSRMFGLHHQIHTVKQNGSSIADYYHKLNAQWKQFDAMVELPKCICNDSESFKKHNQLMKLMQFLMGLDDSYMQIRSSILSREVLPDVRSAYATISSEESHKVASDLKIIRYHADFGKKKSSQNFKGKKISNNNSVGTSLSSGFSEEQMATFPSLIKDNEIGKNVQVNMLGHHAEPVLNVLKESLQIDNKDQIDVKFFENIFPFKDSVIGKNDTTNVFQDTNHINFFDGEYPKMPNDDEKVDHNLNSDNKSQSDSSHSSVSGESVNTANFPKNSRNDADSSEDIFATQNEKVTTLEDNIFSKGNLDQNPSILTQDTQTIRRSLRQSVFPKNYNDFVVESKVKYGLEKYVCYSKLNTENYCFVTQLNKNSEPKSFLEASKYPHWADAMNQEMDALLRNGTWEIVDLPKDRKAIGSKWIYKIKFRSIGDIDRHKARLVAQGFGQKEGIDYEENFFPIVKVVTIRCLFNIVVSMSWPLFQLDVNNAFLYGDLEETICMKPLEGYFPSGNKVCRLKKSLYGLKQAPRQWNAKLTSTLVENGFSQSKSDYSLYTKSDKGVFLALLVYVDDIIITGNNISEIEKFKVFLKSIFMIKDLGKLKYFLGIEIIDTEKDIEISKSYPGLGIHIIKISGMFLNAYSDADWAKCVITRKSVTWYCVFLNDSLVSWKSKKQNTLSKSSTEAKYRALASVTSEVIWILKILKDLNINNILPVNLHCDSNSAIKIAVNPVFHERTTHLEIDLHFVREFFLKGVVKTIKVESANQIADILTKGLNTIQHKELVEKLDMLDVYQLIVLEKALGLSLKKLHVSGGIDKDV